MVLMANALWRSMSAKSCTEFDVRVSFVSSCSTHHKAVWDRTPTAGVVPDPVPQRTLKTMLAVCLTPFVILCLTPCILPIRWPRLLWTYLLPVIPFVVCFDGWMSCLRAYSQQELSEIVRSLPGGEL